MTNRWLATALLLPVGLAGAGTAQPGESSRMRTEILADELTLFIDEDPIFVYRYENVPRKPYLKEWYTPSGLNILRDTPADHLHHHGLMFAIKVNGVNYWEEGPDSGHQVHAGRFEVLAGAGTAGIVQELTWMDPESDTPLVRERRTIEHSPLSDGRMRILTWTSLLEAADPDAPDGVTLGGRIYHGLGMRFPAFMDQVGAFVMSDDKSGAFDDGPNHRLAEARWCAYRVDHDGHPVTVAMFHDPGNPRPTLWFTMRAPFAYLSATQDLMRAPMTLRAGETVEFRHGIAVWDEAAGEEEIEHAYRAWRESARDAVRIPTKGETP